MTSASLTPGVASFPHTHTRTTPAPRPTTSRTPASVGQALPSHRSNNARSPSLHHTPRSPSPNYFGLSIERAEDCMSSGGGQHARTNWSPPTSNVRSTAAASPRVIPLDQNPEFEAFRRQSERAGFNSGSLSTFSMGAPAPRRTIKPAMASTSIASSPRTVSPLTKPTPSTSTSTAVAPYDTKLAETKQRSPKRLLSSPAQGLTDRPRRNSPAGFTEREANNAPKAVHLLADDREMRLSLPHTDRQPFVSNNRADTLPASLNEQASVEAGSTFVNPELVVRLLETAKDDVLLLDLRVSTQYSKSRIEDALNLCIPTTLLKRPSYNPSKLAETFKAEEQRRKFERWRNCKYIVVYDGNSSKIKDAAPCAKMLEKFANEGWTGASYILRGGFIDFSKKFPNLISHGSAAGLAGSVMFSSGSNLSLPPVIGGCPMPVTENAANPFFSNIRQNMDLIGGVGQMALQLPSSLTKQQEEDLPQWLRAAADPRDDGKMASDKFLEIEKKEQKRMQEALSETVVYGTPKGDGDEKPVQLAGIEKGAKNRYNNIWPFEHSRVKVEGVPSGSCDYFNANHIFSEWSNKRYIATQGPIPATFTVGTFPTSFSISSANIFSGFLEGSVAARRPCNCHAHGRKRGWSAQSSQLLGREAVWPSSRKFSFRTPSLSCAIQVTQSPLRFKTVTRPPKIY
jgi:hypothetical protein